MNNINLDPADAKMERSILLKRLSKWKLAFFAMLIIFSLILIKRSGNTPLKEKKSTEIIAIIDIQDVITENDNFDQLLSDVEVNDSIKALIVNINSPGGKSGASENIYLKLKRISAKKPVVSSMGSVAASGGYMVALASDRIYALNSTITGSIGVIMQYPELVDLAEKMGVNIKTFKSQKLKASPSPLEKATAESSDAIMATIMDNHDFFVGLVAENRKISFEEAAKLADGRVYTGRQAKTNKLIDEIGTIDDAVVWLKESKNINKNASIKHLKPKKPNEFLELLMQNIDQSAKSILNNIWNKISFSGKYEIK
jgi:protease IV